MDARTIKLMNSIDDYLDHIPSGVPDQIVQQMQNTKDMLSAPIYSGESPGERAAREVSEANMPEEVSEEYNDNAGVLSANE